MNFHHKHPIVLTKKKKIFFCLFASPSNCLVDSVVKNVYPHRHHHHHHHQKSSVFSPKRIYRIVGIKNAKQQQQNSSMMWYLMYKFFPYIFILVEGIDVIHAYTIRFKCVQTSVSDFFFSTISFHHKPRFFSRLLTNGKINFEKAQTMRKKLIV